MVVDQNSWVEYEFRFVAANSVGIGEPSTPSELLRTKASSKLLKILPMDLRALKIQFHPS